MENSDLYAGIDLGGTTINIGLFTTDGALAAASQIPTLVPQGPGPAMDRTAGEIRRLMEELPGKTLKALGAGAAGLINTREGRIGKVENLPGWEDTPLQEMLVSRLRVPVEIENDANTAALGEYAFGAGRGTLHMVMLTLGTGVGGGLILNGQLYSGLNGYGGELGHMVIRPDGPPCACGAAGCLEVYCSREALSRNGKTPREMAALAEEGDPEARELFRTAGEALGIAIANLINLLDVERIVIGGGLANAGELLLGPARERADGIIMDPALVPVPIVRAALGEQAGMIGAARLVMPR